MTQAISLLSTISGSYTDSSLSGESWQVGIRYAIDTSNLDAVSTFPTDWAVTGNTVNRDETECTIVGNWRLTKGLVQFQADDFLYEQMLPAVGTLFGYPDISSKVVVEQLKLYPIGSPTGKAVPAPPFATGTPMTLTYKSGSQPVGGGSANIAPLQLSIVTGFQTQQVGRPGRGRIYLPGFPSGKINANGMISSGDQTEYATILAEYLGAARLQGVGGLWVEPCVTGGTFTSYGLINNVRVGRIVDTQRRRRRSLTESYVTVAVP